MNIKNVEFKAKVDDLLHYEKLLYDIGAQFMGIDHQIDTYFNASFGRLKLREGNIENALIQYDRENTSSSKLSQVILYQHAPDPALKNILISQLGVKTIVDKQRKIFIKDNVKFHLDEVKNIGYFIEVEVIDKDNSFTEEQLQNVCDQYFTYFKLAQTSLQALSYSDMIMELNEY